MWSVARRPKWIGMLVLALAVAAAFAALGQWQLARSVASGTVVERDTETVKPLVGVADPQEPIPEVATGQLVSASGEFIGTDYSVLSDRLNGGTSGYWVIGRFQVDDGETDAALAVALGWAPTEVDATSVLQSLSGGRSSIEGRYLAPDSPQETDFENGERSAMSPAALVNTWSDFDGDVYGGYLVSSMPTPGLELIDSPVPSSEVSLNWLNIFYAAEWVVFAGFAIFMWYRLVKDAWEREIELAEDERASGAPTRSAAEVN